MWFYVQMYNTAVFQQEMWNHSSTDEIMSMDQRFLKIILESHILKNKITLSQLYNGQRLETVGGKLLRVFIYRTVRLPFWTFAHKLWRSASKDTLYALTPSPHHQSQSLWDVTIIPVPWTCGLFLQAVCIENACLVRGSKEGSNGALHLMKTFLKPAENNMFEILTENGGFK